MRNIKILFEKGDERDWQEIMEKEILEKKYKKFKKRQMDILDNHDSDRAKLRISPKLKGF